MNCHIDYHWRPLRPLAPLLREMEAMEGANNSMLLFKADGVDFSASLDQSSVLREGARNPASPAEFTHSVTSSAGGPAVGAFGPGMQFMPSMCDLSGDSAVDTRSSSPTRPVVTPSKLRQSIDEWAVTPPVSASRSATSEVSFNVSAASSSRSPKSPLESAWSPTAGSKHQLQSEDEPVVPKELFASSAPRLDDDDDEPSIPLMATTRVLGGAEPSLDGDPSDDEFPLVEEEFEFPGHDLATQSVWEPPHSRGGSVPRTPTMSPQGTPPGLRHGPVLVESMDLDLTPSSEVLQEIGNSLYSTATPEDLEFVLPHPVVRRSPAKHSNPGSMASPPLRLVPHTVKPSPKKKRSMPSPYRAPVVNEPRWADRAPVVVEHEPPLAESMELPPMDDVHDGMDTQGLVNAWIKMDSVITEEEEADEDAEQHQDDDDDEYEFAESLDIATLASIPADSWRQPQEPVACSLTDLLDQVDLESPVVEPPVTDAPSFRDAPAPSRTQRSKRSAPKASRRPVAVPLPLYQSEEAGEPRPAVVKQQKKKTVTTAKQVPSGGTRVHSKTHVAKKKSSIRTAPSKLAAVSAALPKTRPSTAKQPKRAVFAPGRTTVVSSPEKAARPHSGPLIGPPTLPTGRVMAWTADSQSATPSPGKPQVLPRRDNVRLQTRAKMLLSADRAIKSMPKRSHPYLSKQRPAASRPKKHATVRVTEVERDTHPSSGLAVW
jgi:hypothetical protein